MTVLSNYLVIISNDFQNMECVTLSRINTHTDIHTGMYVHTQYTM